MVRGVIFDWAGTTIDFGCFAPLNVFVEIFKAVGITITVAEARGPMGMLKRDHVRAILQLPRISAIWREKHGCDFTEQDVDDLYSEFEPALVRSVVNFTDILDGVVETVAELRKREIKIGSTTGYPRVLMDVVVPAVEQKGYKPDCIITAEDVNGFGRPFPFMLQENMKRLGIEKAKNVVKVGDTVADIKEAVNAGVWAVGVIVGSSEMGLTEQEYRSLSQSEQERICARVHRVFLQSGADFVINDMSELPALIDTINERQKHYLLLTPGPLTTTQSVRAAMQQDWCTWDSVYNGIIQKLRKDLVSLATKKVNEYTTVLMQGSGTFSVESVIGSVIPRGGKLLVLSNGAYGDRIAEIARILGIEVLVQDIGEVAQPDLTILSEKLSEFPEISHVAVVHCETTTGMLNDIKAIGEIVKKFKKIYIVDAMSSFGGIPIDVAELNIDFLVSSANKCVQGVPGFGFTIAKLSELEKCKGYARSLSLDLYGQWRGMEDGNGKWRYTSPTHVVRAFCQALLELELEGGVSARESRYKNNQKTLVEGMKKLGFDTLLHSELQSPIITAFYYPKDCDFTFSEFYSALKKKGYVIYPGKISKAETFRIGNIGDVHEKDITGLLVAIEKFLQDRGK